MSDDLSRLKAQIEELSTRLRRVEERVFEHRPQTAPSPPPPVRPREEKPEEPLPRLEIPVATILSLIGRTLVVLGGAFLLRWLTQEGFLPHRVGSIIGMIYALLWIALADRAAGRGHRLSGVFHGITGAFIAFPLLVESTTKFHYLTPMLSALHLAAFIILGLVVAGRRSLRSLAWIVTLPAAPLSFVLAVRTETMTPFLSSLLILGFVTLWLGYLRRWHVLATLMAAAANFGLGLMVMDRVVTSRREGAAETGGLWEVLFLLVGLIVLYFGSYCFRVFRRKRTITALEIGQTLVVVLIGIGGAAMVIDAGEYSVLPLGIVCLVLAAAAYAAAYGLLPRQDPNRRNFLFYTLLGLVMLLLGCEMALGHSWAPAAFAAIALGAGVLSKPIVSPVLYLHGAVYLLAAFLGSGALGATINGFAGSPSALSVWTGIPVLSAIGVVIAYTWLPRPRGRNVDMFLGRRAGDVFLYLLILTLGSLAISVFARVSPLGEETDTYRRLLAAFRTGALAFAALLLASVSGRSRFRNLAWLVYATLGIGALKLVFEDIAAGGTLTLFLSLGLYGGTLILAPRILHRSSSGAKEEGAGDPSQERSAQTRTDGMKHLFILAVATGLGIAGPAAGTRAKEIRVAVASNFTAAAAAVAERFESDTGHAVTVIAGSTGKHFAQIQNGAPFAVFLAADDHHPERLEREGIAVDGTRFTYATGEIVLWSPRPGHVDSKGRVLERDGFRYLAIANPRLAPYGRAAREVLEKRGLWKRLAGRIVRGENVSQTLQFVRSGNAQMGFVARSQVMGAGGPVQGSVWEVPQALYAPIEQQAVLLVDDDVARAFLAFLRSEEGRELIRTFGYGTP